MNHCVPGLAGEQAEFRKLLKKNVTFTVTEKIMKELEAAKKTMGNNILLNAFNVTKRTLVITDASGEGFGQLLMLMDQTRIVVPETMRKRGID